MLGSPNRGGPRTGGRRWRRLAVGSAVLAALIVALGAGLALWLESDLEYAGRPPVDMTVGGGPEPEPEPQPAPPDQTAGSPPPLDGEVEGGGPPSPPTAGAEPPPTAGAEPPQGPAPPASFPTFPWPPPSASAVQPLPDPAPQLGASPTLGRVAAWIEGALEKTGYFDRSFLAVPEGFAMVTRLEQINEDGMPVSETTRWPVEIDSPGFSLARYLEALFHAPEGRYRVIVFVVTSEPVAPSRERPTQREMLGYLSGGADRLPPPLRDAAYTPEHRCTALVYEFERRGLQGRAALLVPGRLPGRNHLVGAGLWRALAASNG
jgi:hypothetical protein